MKNTFLFILTPPYSGSTLLVRILESSSNVSLNNNKGTCEGQKLPELRHLFDSGGRWDPYKELDWAFIKSVWMEKWDTSKAILLEKSPPNLIRAQAIEECFDSVRFVLLIRNPYAICDSLKFRNDFDVQQASRMVLRFFRHQYKNISNYRNALLIRYEDLVSQTQNTIKSLQAYVPELGPLYVKESYELHNSTSKSSAGIVNSNANKLARFSVSELEQCRKEFEKEKELIEYFGYSIDPCLH